MNFLVYEKINDTIFDVKFYAESNENVRFGVSFQEKSRKAQNNSKYTHLRYKNYFCKDIGYVDFSRHLRISYCNALRGDHSYMERIVVPHG